MLHVAARGFTRAATCELPAGARRDVETSVPAKEAGEERIFTLVAALVDTNVLVYRFDNRFPDNVN